MGVFARRSKLFDAMVGAVHRTPRAVRSIAPTSALCDLRDLRGKMKRAKMSLILSDYDYALPEDLIARRSLPRRDESRMMVLHREDANVEHRQF